MLPEISSIDEYFFQMPEQSFLHGFLKSSPYSVFNVLDLPTKKNWTCLVNKLLGDSDLSIDLDAARFIYWGLSTLKKNVGVASINKGG